MKAIKLLATAAVITFCSAPSFAQIQGQSAITEATMKAYQKLLDENPQDYETLYRRATEYYRYDQYLRALNDINEALKYTPVSDSDMRFQELSLRANIYEMTGKPELALIDLTQACELVPDNYVAIYQKANVEYELGKYDASKADYQKLKRLSTRSVEALFGLARVAVKEQNLGLANEYVDEAVNAYPSNADVYVRRAAVRESMGNNVGAVDDYLMALSIDNSYSKALRGLVNMSNTDYSAVMTGLSNAIRQAPKVGMFYYLRAAIAQNHNRYKAALADYKYIVDEGLYDHHGIYASMAECQYALGNYPQGAMDIEYAIGATADNAAYYVTLAQIRRAQWRSEDALAASEKALEKAPDYAPAQAQKALALVDLQKYQEASDAIGGAILNDGENAYYQLIRAWILEQYLNKPTNAATIYERVANWPMEDGSLASSDYRGFGMLFSGQKEKAYQWAADLVANDKNHDGTAQYRASCLYAQAGDANKALDLMAQALELGYANRHDWNRADDARVNVAPLRDLPRFSALLDQYSSIF
ncbi:MAG: tetratricopeptide repeat protein [Bacteroidales bacterium]|nr:tetratricopeptide repeat protein [Bacteroidales bacterium]MCD8393440.1 tetratricopeptide repeat protein [Bacteroidales bacterium]